MLLKKISPQWPRQMLILVILVCAIDIVTSLRDVLVKMPHAVRRGEKAILKCLYDLEGDALYSVKWYKGRREFYSFTPKDTPAMKVFQFQGVKVDRSFSNESQLVLDAVNLATTGKYSCEVSADAPSFHTLISAGELEVVVPGKDPVIAGIHSRYKVGDILRGNCTSRHSKPAANITWTINGHETNPSHVRHHRPAKDSRDLDTAISNIQFVVTPKHFIHGKIKIRCIAFIHDVYWKSTEKSIEEDRHKYHSGNNINLVHTFPDDYFDTDDDNSIERSDTYLTHIKGDVSSLNANGATGSHYRSIPILPRLTSILFLLYAMQEVFQLYQQLFHINLRVPTTIIANTKTISTHTTTNTRNVNFSKIFIMEKMNSKIIKKATTIAKIMSIVTRKERKGLTPKGFLCIRKARVINKAREYQAMNLQIKKNNKQHINNNNKNSNTHSTGNTNNKNINNIYSNSNDTNRKYNNYTTNNTSNRDKNNKNKSYDKNIYISNNKNNISNISKRSNTSNKNNMSSKYSKNDIKNNKYRKVQHFCGTSVANSKRTITATPTIHIVILIAVTAISMKSHASLTIVVGATFFSNRLMSLKKIQPKIASIIVAVGVARAIIKVSTGISKSTTFQREPTAAKVKAAATEAPITRTEDLKNFKGLQIEEWKIFKVNHHERKQNLLLLHIMLFNFLFLLLLLLILIKKYEKIIKANLVENLKEQQTCNTLNQKLQYQQEQQSRKLKEKKIEKTNILLMEMETPKILSNGCRFPGKTMTTIAALMRSLRQTSKLRTTKETIPTPTPTPTPTCTSSTQSTSSSEMHTTSSSAEAAETKGEENENSEVKETLNNLKTIDKMATPGSIFLRTTTNMIATFGATNTFATNGASTALTRVFLGNCNSAYNSQEQLVSYKT